jgi:hypothetical protein
MEVHSMVQFLVANTMQFLEQALWAVLVAVVGGLLSWLIKIKAKKPRAHQFKIDLGVASVAAVITAGGTRQERKALKEAESEGRDS